MSNNPYSAPSSTVDYGNAGSPAYATVLPTVIKALAIISICLGGFNIFGGICGVIGMGAAAAVTNSTQIQQQMESDNPQAAAEFRKAMGDMQKSLPMYIAQAAFSVIVSIGLIIGGIGVLKRKEWGRKWLVYSCIAYLLVTLISWVFTALATAKNMEGMDSAQQTGAIFGMVFAFAFGLIFLAFYLFVAIYMSKASTKQQFQQP